MADFGVLGGAGEALVFANDCAINGSGAGRTEIVPAFRYAVSENPHDVDSGENCLPPVPRRWAHATRQTILLRPIGHRLPLFLWRLDPPSSSSECGPNPPG